MGDYWFSATATEDTPIVPDSESETKMEKEGITWWQKMMVCNKIDICIAVFSVVGCSTLGFIQIFYGSDPWFYAPTVPILAIAIGAKMYGATKFAEYGETKDGDALWWGFCFHSIWHLFLGLLAVFQIYGLMTDGFVTPAWLSFCC